jgi:hypothetical protein
VPRGEKENKEIKIVAIEGNRMQPPKKLKKRN